jgi:Tol biopolymer transport system component
MTVRPAWPLPVLILASLFLALSLASGGTGPAGAAYPGANGRLSFTSVRDGNDEIYSMGLDGSSLQRLTNHPLTDDNAVWSPDGAKIAFERQVEGSQYAVWIMNADGSGEQQLSPVGTDDGSPTWSPDGTKIAFSSFTDSPAGPDVWVMDADGGNRQNLTNMIDWDRDPSWSPDGSMIAFRSERDGNAEIYVMNADGSDQTRLTFTPGIFDAGPKWSADSSRIFWGAGNTAVHSIKPDGTDEEVLTEAPVFADDPAPSPDGQFIAFEGDDGIYTMKPNGSDITIVPGTTSDDYRPDWQPLAGGSGGRAGDADCDGDADPVDALHVLRSVAGLPNTAACLANANVKCDDGMTSVDALLILRSVAGLDVNLPQECPEIGDIIVAVQAAYA